MIPLSKVRPVHREISEKMRAAGLDRVRGALRGVEAEGYKAVFAGPHRADGRRPAVRIWIPELDLLVAHDIDLVGDLVAKHADAALQSYRAITEQQPIEGREAEHARVSAMAGLDPDGGLLPPSSDGGIDRSPSPYWSNRGKSWP